MFNLSQVLDVFKRHDLEVSKSWKELSHSSMNTDQIIDKLSDHKDIKHLNHTDRAVPKSPLDSHSVLPSRFAIPSKVSFHCQTSLRVRVWNNHNRVFKPGNRTQRNAKSRLIC